MQFSARVGILEGEIANAQPIEVDLSLTVARALGEIDQTSILDYRHAYSLVAEILMAGHIDYLEEVAERIAEAALALPLVKKVNVAVRKPRVALPGPLSYAEVAIERGRG
jgi:dihydroneopterin aldolase